MRSILHRVAARRFAFGVNPWRTHSRFLVSHNLLIDPTYAARMREWLGDLQPGSLLILDEAHHAAPSSGGGYGIETQLTCAVRDFSSRFERRPVLPAMRRLLPFAPRCAALRIRRLDRFARRSYGGRQKPQGNRI